MVMQAQRSRSEPLGRQEPCLATPVRIESSLRQRSAPLLVEARDRGLREILLPLTGPASLQPLHVLVDRPALASLRSRRITPQFSPGPLLAQPVSFPFGSGDLDETWRLAA